MATQVEDESKTGVKEYEREGDKGESDACYIDQTELNVLLQKWIDGLSSLPVDVESKLPFTPKAVPMESQDLSTVLDSLKRTLQLQQVPRTSSRAGGTHIAILARSLMYYLSVALQPKAADQLALKITEQTTKWICALFRFDATKFAAFYHNDNLEGLRKVLKIALHCNCERFLQEGFMALYTNPPVVYVGASGPVTECENVLTQLGLPPSTLRIVPTNTMFGSAHAMDTATLEQLIVEDKSHGKMPLFIMAAAGAHVAGHIDNITRLRELCDQHNMWLHVQGNALASLCLTKELLELGDVKNADSVTLKPGQWFGILTAPQVTLYRRQLFPVPHPPQIEQKGNSAVPDLPKEDAGVSPNRLFLSPKVWMALQPNGTDNLLSLILWVCLQYIGEQNLLDTVSYSHNLTNHLVDQLSTIEGIKRRCVPNHWTPVVLFKYTGGGQIEAPPTFASDLTVDTQPEGGETESSDGSALTIMELPQQTADGFTHTIVNQISHVAGKIGITVFKLQDFGLCCRFDPTESFPEHGISMEDVSRFCSALAASVRGVHTLALSRVVFQKGLVNHPRLRYLEFPATLAVGFAQYIPECLVGKKEITVEEVKNLNRLNEELACVLRLRSEAFASFQHGNFTCIQLTVVPEGITVHSLMLMLFQETSHLETSKKQLDELTERVMKGIQEAELDLQKEKDKKQEEESVFHNVPLVGSVLGWFYPTSPSVPGRSFNLQRGVLTPTSKVYEQGMQINTGEDVAGCTGDTRFPPTKEEEKSKEDS